MPAVSSGAQEQRRVVPGPRGSLPECDIFCVFNLISQIRVVSRDALKVFHQQHANSAEPMLDRKYISTLIKMLGITNVHPCCNLRQMFDRSDV